MDGDGRFSAYHHSHPTLTERVKELEMHKAKRAKAKGAAGKKEQ